MSAGAVLTATGLTLTVGPRRTSRVLLPPCDLRVLPGALVVLLGPNGAGKSTLLRALAGLRPLQGGTVTVGGRSVATTSAAALARRRAFLGTDRLAVPELTVREMVRLGRLPHTDGWGWFSPADEAATDAALGRWGLHELGDRRIGSLSDGERQRAAVARAAAQDAPLLLLDEPTAFLDVRQRWELLRRLREHALPAGPAVVISTHEVAMAMGVADDVWLLPGGGPLWQGTVAECQASGRLAAVFGEAFVGAPG